MKFAEFIRYCATRGFQWLGSISYRDWVVAWLKWRDNALLQFCDFYAPLTHTAIPQRAASGTTATFTRATASTWKNNDGYMVTGVAGEIGFPGARRVRNLISTSSEDIPNYNNNNTTVSASSEVISGVTSVYDIYEAATTGIHTRNRLFPALAGHRYVCSVRAKAGTLRRVMIRDGAVTGAASTFDLVDGVVVADEAGGVGSIESTEDAGVYLLSMTFTAPADGNYSPYIYLMRDGTAGNWSASYAGNVTKFLTVGGVQVEDVTAQTTQTAGEYVSVGVESAPYYHGSMVDGVKCFPTDLSGNPIPSTTLLGYLAQGARTNLCLQSNAFTTTWTAAGTPAATQNVVGPDGATSAWTLTDNDAGVLEYISQDITLTAAFHTYSVFVKKTTGAQSSYPCVVALSNVGTLFAVCTVDTTNGVATAWTSFTARTAATGLTARCTSYNADFWRVELVFTATAVAWFCALIPAATTSATYAGPTLDATVQGSAVFYGAQVELGSFASSPIATTTAAVTRNADVLTYSSAGNVDGATGWCYAEVTSNAPNSEQVIYLAGTGAGGYVAYHDSDGALKLFDAAAARSLIAEPHPVTTPTSIAVSWGGSSSQGAVNGTVGSAQGFDGDISLAGANLGVGCNAAGVGQIFGNIGPIYIGQRQLSASELGAITA